ncbi:MAG: lipopolysaccharide heptosyltransferase II [Acidobacteriota bacterium]|nr:lipopolysaccharide heptosyltransferase II [Acidobacteriota bacterium]
MTRDSFSARQIERVAVRGVNWVGDAVMTVPALRDLRRLLPDAHITLVTRRWAEGIFDDADFIDDLLIVDEETGAARSLLHQVRDWRARRFDLAVLLPNSFPPALVAALACVPLRVGHATQHRRRLLTHSFNVPEWRSERHEVFYYRRIISELEQLLHGTSTIAAREPQFQIQVSPARRDEAERMLLARGVDLERPVVVVCPGSTNSRAKRWPAERYAALADQLIEEADASVVIIGAREELDVTEEVIQQMRHRPVVLTGETNLAETVAVLSVADLLITNDTGPAHIAAALERPTLVIFGPTNPLTTRPFSPAAEIVRRPPDCAPCMLRDCPIDHRCMMAISVDEVLMRTRVLLDESKAVRQAEVVR